MKKFTKILEEVENERFYKVTAQVELIIPAENDGEAGYMSDSILASIEYGSNYTIDLIDETDERITENIELYQGKQVNPTPEDTPEETIKLTWESEFGDRTPTPTEKMEFYHQMRKAGFDGIMIFKVLGFKLK